MTAASKQFTLMGIAAALFTAVMVIGLAGNVVRGSYLALPIVGGVLVLVLLAGWAGVWANQRRIHLMFRQPTPDKLIANYHASLLQARARKIPHAVEACAWLSGLAAAMYGEFDRARQELVAGDWDGAPAAYRANRDCVLALIALLERPDRDKALRILGDAPVEQAPGLFWTALRVAAGEADKAVIERAQKGAERAVGAIPALCAWGVALECQRRGQAKEASHYIELIRRAAPRFVGLGSTSAERN